MGIPLSKFFELDDSGNIVEDKEGLARINPGWETEKGEKISSFQDYLNVLDKITSISTNSVTAKQQVKELTKLLLHKFHEHLRQNQDDWYGTYNPKMNIIAKQLEAIAYLTGDQEGINQILESFPLLKEYKFNSPTTSFIDNKAPLKFVNFDKNLLAVQMLIRVLDPRFINQRNEQVCGVNSYVHSIALSNPLQYVQMMASLAIDGEVDLPGSNPGESILKIKISEEIANKNSSNGEEIYDADHIILNGMRASQNNIVKYSPEGELLSKQLFGVTTIKEVYNWMQQSDFHRVQTISLHERSKIQQLQLLINDGYRAVFVGTSTLARYIGDNSNKPEKQSLFEQFMDGHLFTINNIEYNEQKDSVKVRIISWGEEVEAEIPFELWKEQIRLSGYVSVGQPPYEYSLLRGNARVINENSTFCSPEGYCLYVQNLIEKKPEHEEIRKLLENVLKHKNGQTWMEAAKKIQDLVEALPPEHRSLMPSKIAIIPRGTPEKIEKINIIDNPEDKIKALEELGAENNIEVRRQLVELYAQNNQLSKVHNLLASVKQYSKTDREILYKSLQSCGIAIPVQLIKTEDLIVYLSKLTGIPEGGSFTYGIKGRLSEVINQRNGNKGNDAIIDGEWLYRADVMNLISLLDNEMQTNDASYEGLNEGDRVKFCNALFAGDEPPSQDLHKESSFWEQIREFFLKVASFISDNQVTNSVKKTKDFKDQINQMQETHGVQEEHDDNPSLIRSQR